MTDNTPRDLGCLDQDTARGRAPRVCVGGGWVGILVSC